MSSYSYNIPSCKQMCSFCGINTPPIGGFKKCAGKNGKCGMRIYCGRVCQRNDWKKRDKKICENENIKLNQHSSTCVYAYKNPEVNDNNFVDSGQLLLIEPNQYVITTGLNTCIFIVVNTEKCTLAWHASLRSTNGKSVFHSNIINKFHNEFKKVGNEYGKFKRGFIIPGVDRDENLNLKLTCRTMIEINPDPTESKNLILGTLKEFKWYKKMIIMHPTNNYKDFIIVDSNHEYPFYYSDISQFDAGCIYDGEIDAPLYKF